MPLILNPPIKNECFDIGVYENKIYHISPDVQSHNNAIYLSVYIKRDCYSINNKYITKQDITIYPDNIIYIEFCLTKTTYYEYVHFRNFYLSYISYDVKDNIIKIYFKNKTKYNVRIKQKTTFGIIKVKRYMLLHKTIKKDLSFIQHFIYNSIPYICTYTNASDLYLCVSKETVENILLKNDICIEKSKIWVNKHVKIDNLTIKDSFIIKYYINKILYFTNKCFYTKNIEYYEIRDKLLNVHLSFYKYIESI